MSKAKGMLFAVFAVFSFVFLQPFAAVATEYHALLIGVGGTFSPLPGPRNDVSALREVLINTYGFQAANITTLVEEQATKKAILEEIDGLTRRSKAGDHVLLYYSGHGTSAYDMDYGSVLELPHTSGALVPYDAEIGGKYTNTQMINSVIVGKRDILPRMKKLEKDRLVLAVFDSCFSENAVRALVKGDGRFIAPSIGPDMGNAFKTSTEGFGKTRKNEPYPYTNVFFISAASESEKAWDAPGSSNYVTFDGKAHGLLTDQLLRVLNGKMIADNNHNDRVSFGELYKAVKDATVSHSEKHFMVSTPHALPENGTLQSEHFFRGVKKPVPVKPPVVVRETTLATKKYPNQSFNVTVDLTGKHGDTVWLGDTVGYSMYTENSAYLLLLSINHEGTVYVIYPYEQEELAKVKAKQTVRLDNLGEVAPPVGREVLKLIAFQDKPQGFDQLLAGEDIRPGSSLYQQLEEMLGLRGSNKDKISTSKAIAQQAITITSMEKDGK